MVTGDQNILKAWGSPKHVLAPMVDGSELAWRMLGRQYGVQLTYTPMIHSVMFLKDKKYRKSCLQFSPSDRPLIAQFCANSPDSFVKAAKLVEPFCDAVDLNLGCPQGIAKRGHYGAFLQDEWDLLTSILKQAVRHLSVPVTCKIRVFSDVERTVEYAKMLETAGASLLVVHGRTREMKGHLTGLADWSQIKRIKEVVHIPVIANGNIQYPRDVQRCLDETGADAVMSAEGHLHNPAIFAGLQPPVFSVSLEYLKFATDYPCPMSIVRGHLFKICHYALDEHPEFRSLIGFGQTTEELSEIVRKMEAVCSNCKTNTNPMVPLPHWICQPYERPLAGSPRTLSSSTQEGHDSSTKTLAIADNARLKEQRRLRREEKREKKLAKRAASALPRPLCAHCQTNFRGSLCPNMGCGQCCPIIDLERSKECPNHRHAKKTKTSV
ncbi:unnamed protein product [Calicophoron daubneyi]|uniref:tRNA-dihydrouridine(16/17) synthase [NAD(P)(+)] n=1 Tax=Calicophoron daubneyi TaxID=300641 RepID=A0AAV2TU18_CALDB